MLEICKDDMFELDEESSLFLEVITHDLTKKQDFSELGWK